SKILPSVIRISMNSGKVMPPDGKSTTAVATTKEVTKIQRSNTFAAYFTNCRLLNITTHSYLDEEGGSKACAESAIHSGRATISIAFGGAGRSGACRGRPRSITQFFGQHSGKIAVISRNPAEPTKRVCHNDKHHG
ncbi:MAG: hypothetical protein WCC78_16620, partial [Terriglobales bacterium]